MTISVRNYTPADAAAAAEIWNEVVRDGVAFPQTDPLTETTGAEFFAAQSRTGVAVNESGEILGLYILHPNNVGRCGHICNTSYAVKDGVRGRHIGEQLVRHSMAQGKTLGYRILQFNAVVAFNTHARHLYERLGFTQLGTIPGGFRLDDGTYADICPYYKALD